jgi:hypothetical protein
VRENAEMGPVFFCIITHRGGRGSLP